MCKRKKRKYEKEATRKGALNANIKTLCFHSISDFHVCIRNYILCILHECMKMTEYDVWKIKQSIR